MNMDVQQKTVRLLIVESDGKMLEEMYAYMERLGYVLDSASTGNAGWHQASGGGYDAIVLDVMLPGMDGLTLCRKLREEAFSNVPIIMLTDSTSLENRVICLNWGADDFVTKPFAMLELEARVRAAVRRARAWGSTRILRWSGIELDPQRHTASCHGRELRLRPKCFAMLARLMRSAPGVVSREDLEHEIYGDAPPESDSLRVHVHLLRKALADAGAPLLKTVPHLGFRLDDGAGSPDGDAEG
jgi:DNA-binding response OmpR family regulator